MDILPVISVTRRQEALSMRISWGPAAPAHCGTVATWCWHTASSAMATCWHCLVGEWYVLAMFNEQGYALDSQENLVVRGKHYAASTS